MNIEPTIPCPVCEAPIFVRQINLPSGEIARIYAEPLSTDEEVIAFHQHQMSDTEAAMKH
jgi:hypothetical protein